MKPLAFLVLACTLACATANPSRFQVRRIDDQMVSMGCFSSQEVMWQETLKTFAPVVKKCPKLMSSIGSYSVAEEGTSLNVGKRYCIAVVFPAQFNCK
jgi:hypothetical protein